MCESSRKREKCEKRVDMGVGAFLWIPGIGLKDLEMGMGRAGLGRAGPAKPSAARPSRAAPSRAGPGQAKPSQAEPSVLS